MLLQSNFDAGRKELQNVVIQKLSAPPLNPIAGLIYFDTTVQAFAVYQGGAWVYLSVAGNVSKAANASAANVMQVSGGADKTVADFLSAGGIIKVSATGVVSLAAAGTDYLTAASTNALTNKTFDAAGVGNSLVNLLLSNFASGVIDTDTALAANSDTRVPTQKAVKAAIATAVSSVAKPMGGIDASTNPNFPAANVGEYYRITVAGLIGGAAGFPVQIGDELHNFVTSIAGTAAAVGANWTVIQTNVDQATASTLGLVTLATSVEAEAKTNTLKAVTPAALANFTQKKIATIGDGVATSIVISDGLNSVDKIAVVRDAATNAQILVDITYALNTTTVIFAVAPATASYKIVIIG